MTFSAVVDVALGLVVAYFLFSVAASRIVEAIAGWRGWRAKGLESALRQMLQGHPKDSTAFEASSVSATELLDHDLVKTERRPKLFGDGTKAPAYIRPRTFALALLDLLAPNSKATDPVSLFEDEVDKLPDGHPAKKPLRRLVARAGSDRDRLITEIEGWYDAVMDRISGWYKAKARVWVLGVGLLLTVMFNVDTLGIATTLYRDGAARQAVATAAAEQAKAAQPDSAGAAIKKAKTLDLPLGWVFSHQDSPTTSGPRDPRRPSPDPAWIFLKVMGILLTTGALTFGGPFWFDVLGKLANVRNTGQKPESERGTATKDAAA